ncbi:hypothetical protein [Reyranella sp.]|uniref:hypothetical protein n=1 Tax=Reyranella sp. TaxID=1929291 RepID=UPI003C7D7AE5
MSLNGKRDHFELSDLIQFGGDAYAGRKLAAFAEQAGVAEKTARAIHQAMRREIIISA